LTILSDPIRNIIHFFLHKLFWVNWDNSWQYLTILCDTWKYLTILPNTKKYLPILNYTNQYLTTPNNTCQTWYQLVLSGFDKASSITTNIISNFSTIKVASWYSSDSFFSAWYHHGTYSGNFSKTFGAYPIIDVDWNCSAALSNEMARYAKKYFGCVQRYIKKEIPLSKCPPSQENMCLIVKYFTPKEYCQCQYLTIPNKLGISWYHLISIIPQVS